MSFKMFYQRKGSVCGLASCINVIGLTVDLDSETAHQIVSQTAERESGILAEMIAEGGVDDFQLNRLLRTMIEVAGTEKHPVVYERKHILESDTAEFFKRLGAELTDGARAIIGLTMPSHWTVVASVSGERVHIVDSISGDNHVPFERFSMEPAPEFPDVITWRERRKLKLPPPALHIDNRQVFVVKRA